MGELKQRKREIAEIKHVKSLRVSNKNAQNLQPIVKSKRETHQSAKIKMIIDEIITWYLLIMTRFQIPC